MPDRRLPDHPDIDQLKHQAKDLLRNMRRGEPAAVAAFKKHHSGPIEAVNVKLADAQFRAGSNLWRAKLASLGIRMLSN